MMSFILMASFITAVGFISMIAKASPTWLKRILGYELYVDIALDLFIGVYAGMSGTISGMVIGGLTGIIIGLTLFVTRHFIGYQRYEIVDAETNKREWIAYPPSWSIPAFKAWFTNKTAKYNRKDTYAFSGTQSR